MKIIMGDCLEVLKELPNNYVQCCVTSPPYYGLRDYGVEGQIGLEETPEAYVDKLVNVFREVKRVLKDDGTLWLNLGDSYAGSGGPGSQYDNKSSNSFKGEFKKYDNPNKKVSGLKPKDLIGIPWMVAFALRADGWWLRSDIIWHKPNPMPESVTDRPTKSHEYIFLLSRSAKYYYDYEAILEKAAYDGRKDTMFKGSVKNYDLAMPGGKPQTFAQRGHERWSRTLPKNLKEDGQKPNTMHIKREERKLNQQTISLVYSAGKNTETGEYVGNKKDGIPARNKRDVWSVNLKPYRGAHFATFPPDLIEPCILAGSKPGDIVLDPFNGAGTTGMVAIKHNRDYIGIELNPEYVKLTEERLKEVQSVLVP